MGLCGGGTVIFSQANIRQYFVFQPVNLTSSIAIQWSISREEYQNMLSGNCQCSRVSVLQYLVNLSTLHLEASEIIQNGLSFF